MRRYPHQLSGGMQQRVVIAMALAKDPSLLILDEPTTGLDATVEAEVLDLVAALRAEFGTSVLFISHNLDVIARMCDRVGVLYAGRLVEEGPVDARLRRPAPPLHRRPAALHPARRRAQGPRAGSTRSPASCPRSAPSCPRASSSIGARSPRTSAARRSRRCTTRRRARSAAATSGEQAHDAAARDVRGAGADRASTQDAAPVVRAEHLRKTFKQDGHEIHAVQDIALTLRPGETLGLVGESGSGKTTLARLLLGLTEPDEGSVVELDGHAARGPDPPSATPDEVRALQIVFQNPDSALNRRFSIQRIIGRAITKLLGKTGREQDERLAELARVGPLRRAADQGAAGAALGRPQAARGDRAGVRRRAARRGLRRADVRARRLGPGRDPQPARRAPDRPRRSPTCSSRTTSASCATSRTASPCSTSAG